MKKLLLMMLLIVGGVNAASATEYSVQFHQGEEWYKLCDLTDEDGDGVYSAIVNMEEAEKLGWEECEIQLCTGTVLSDGWSNALWANFNSNGSILSYDHFTLSKTYSKGGKLTIPITVGVDKPTYAIRLDYTEADMTIRATRLIEFASNRDNWHDTPQIYVYMEETAHNSGIFTKEMELQKDTEFKFISNNYGGIAWYGKDNNVLSTDGKNINIGADGSYIITANLNGTYVEPSLIKVPVSVSSYGVATFCSNYPLDFTGIEDVKAYTIIASDKATGALTKDQVTGKVAAGTGLYLEGTANASVNVPTTIHTESAGTNRLVGVTSDTNISQIDGENTNYILTVNTKNGVVATPKFYKVNSEGNTVEANRAYLQIPTELASRESFWFEDGVITTIESAKQEQSLNGVAYNLAGQRIAQPTKGLYIVNGKKIIMK